jgi:NitT/TauT family transport system substrate-binding protein
MHVNARCVTGAALVAVLAAGCGTAKAVTASAPGLRTITVGVVASEASAGIYIAQEQGLFRRQGLDVTLQTITGAAAVLPALLHGSVGVVGAQLTTFIQAQATGVAQFRILAPGGSLGPRVNSVMVLAHSPVTSPAQLKGVTVAVNAAGGIDQILAEAALSAYGIQPGQVRYVAIPFQDMITALARRDVAAAYMSEPYVTEAEQQLGAIPVLDPDIGMAQDMPISAYVATRAWALRYPRTAAAFGRAIDQADALIITRPSVFASAMEHQLHLPGRVAGVMATGGFPTSLGAAHEQQVADILETYGLLKAPFSVQVMLP